MNIRLNWEYLDNGACMARTSVGLYVISPIKTIKDGEVRYVVTKDGDLIENKLTFSIFQLAINEAEKSFTDIGRQMYNLYDLHIRHNLKD